MDRISALAGAVACVLYGLAYQFSGYPIWQLYFGAVFYAFAALLAARRRYTPALRELTLALTLFGSVHVQWLAGGAVASGVNEVGGLISLIRMEWVGSRSIPARSQPGRPS